MVGEKWRPKYRKEHTLSSGVRLRRRGGRWSKSDWGLNKKIMNLDSELVSELLSQRGTESKVL